MPPDGAARFAEALRSTYQSCPDRLRVNVHSGIRHDFAPAMLAKAVEWFRRTG